MDYFEHLREHPELIGDPGNIHIVTDPAEIEAWQEARRAVLAARSKPLDWAEIGIILDDPYVLVLRDLVEFPGGFRNGHVRLVNRAELSGGQAVVVLPVKDGQVLLLRHFRHPTRRWHLEVPRGFGEPDLPAEENARKEVLEETGGEVLELVDLGWMYNNTGMESLGVRLFFAQVDSATKPEIEEGIEGLIWVSISEFERMIAVGEIDDGFTMAAYARARLKGLLG